MFLRKNLSESKIHHYIKTLTEVYEITGKTSYQLIFEAKKNNHTYTNGIPHIKGY
ncbi:MAG: hypothetical protein LBM26_01755 [Methanobrevibacter sp.]|jgi:hypothetical protein|nr:hypothetical protein [Methanobrevibacter sp.]